MPLPLPVANIPSCQSSEHLPGCHPLPETMPGKGHALSSSTNLPGLQPQSQGKDSNRHLSEQNILFVEMAINERLGVEGRFSGDQPGQPVLLGEDRSYHPEPEEAGQTTHPVASCV